MARTPTPEPHSVRNPESSLDERIDRVARDAISGYYLTAATLWVIAAVEWLARLLNYSLMPFAYAVAALVATGFCSVKFVRAQVRARRLQKTRDAQRDVSAFLDAQRRHGAQIFHLIPQQPDKAGHVVVCSRGIFVIQTRCSRQPHKELEMRFDGAQIQIARQLPDAAAIAECQAEVELMNALALDAASKPWKVRGIVVFLDWHVIRTSSALGSQIWVLNPDELERWIGREPEVMCNEDVAKATLHLQRRADRFSSVGNN
jgi:hypothetical protein